jgi:hypothetical protein
MLTALHHHCMQLLAQARDLLSPQACTLSQVSNRSTNSSISGGSAGRSGSSRAHGEQAAGASGSSAAGFEQQRQQQQAGEVLQQQRQAWQLCLAQVQHNLLLVMQLTKHWQHHNAHLCLDMVLSKNRCVEGL